VWHEFTSGTQRQKTLARPPGIDTAVFAQLPEDMQQEVVSAHEHHQSSKQAENREKKNHQSQSIPRAPADSESSQAPGIHAEARGPLTSSQWQKQPAVAYRHYNGQLTSTSNFRN
jgi:hypothetical protein